MLALLLPVLLVLGLIAAARLAVEWQWFGQFDVQAVLLRRWVLQLLAFVLVFGPGSLLQLQQLQRCWRLRAEAGRKRLSALPLLRLGAQQLVVALLALLMLLSVGLSYVLVQAHDLIEAPFSGQVITGFSLVRDLPPLLPVKTRFLSVVGLAGVKPVTLAL